MAVPIQSAANLRSGPGTQYTRIGRLPIGDRMEIVGRNANATWWLVAAPAGFAWVANDAVATFNVDPSIPVVAIPALLVYQDQTSSSAAALVPPTTMLPETGNTVSLPMPAGTPTAEAVASRRFVQDTRGYKQLTRLLMLPTVSESFSPHGDQIAITEKIKLYIISTNGTASRILLEDTGTIDLIGNAVWSPDGQYIAFVADNLQDASGHIVGITRASDGSIIYLEPPEGMNVDMPRWTQDGRLLVNVHPGDPIHGTVFIYNTAGQGQAASGVYLLSSNHDGQKWSPWQPGKTWQVDAAQPTSYYGN
jgi:hypothetical protein